MTKRVVIFWVCVAVAAGLAFAVTRWLISSRVVPVDNQLAWLQSEFHLSPAQVAQIKTLHDDYQPVCRVHCQQIQQARIALAAVSPSSPAGTADLAQAELKRVEAVCHDATRAHLQRVAAIMAPAEGARFLALVLPKLSSQTHDAPCELK